MLVSKFYDSEYLKASDLGKTPVAASIRAVGAVELQGTAKMLLSFVGKHKGLLLNRTNAARLSEVWGDDTDEWTGHTVILSVDRVQFQGKLVDSIRCEPSNKRRIEPEPESDESDDLPF